MENLILIDNYKDKLKTVSEELVKNETTLLSDTVSSQNRLLIIGMIAILKMQVYCYKEFILEIGK